jgi:ParB-like chromosome segregation protein Spo0J
MGMFDKARKAAADTLTDDIQMIDIDRLRESPDNFFEVSRVEEFAQTILGQGGVKENLIVKPLEDGDYEIISGHRRTAAIRHLLEQGEDVSRVLPCLVQHYDDEDDKLLDVVLMNISARIISDAEKWKAFEILNDTLQRKKKAGEKFGQVQKTLAELLGVSTGQTAKMQNIDKNAAEEVKKALKNGDISINTAEKISKLDKPAQKKLAEKPLSGVKPKDIEKVITNDNFPKEEDESWDGGEDSTPEPDEEVIISDNFSGGEDEDGEEDHPAANDLSDYMTKNSRIINRILDNYLSTTSDMSERNVIATIIMLIRNQNKEEE